MRLLSPRELADALGVSESSLKRWVDAGKITAARTDGGHRKISLPEAVRFIRETGAPVAHPELLDMPEVAVAQATAAGRDGLFGYFVTGDAVGARGWLLARYLGGASVAELCDGAMRDAMHRIGEMWRHDGDGVFIEHRATDTCLQAVAHLRNMIEVRADAPVALGAAPEDDPYIVPSFMAATVVAAQGMRAVNLGPNTPVTALHHAVSHHQPRLVWISTSTLLPPARARELVRWLLALPATTVALVGGRHSTELAAAHPGVRRVDSMVELAAVAAAAIGRDRPA